MTDGCPFESLDEVQPRCTIALLNYVASCSEIPHFIPQTNPTPPDESDTTGPIRPYAPSFNP
jgi:hypothetical protein